MERKKMMVIDGSSLLFRAFYAMPLLSTKEGIYTNAIYGFLNMFYKAVEENKPDYISVAFDKSGPTFRHEMYDEYKGTRSEAPDEISQQFPLIKEVLEAMNIVVLESEEYEADDIVGTLAKKAEAENIDAYLVTGDKDYLQLASETTKIVFTKKGISETDVYDRQKVFDEYGIEPNQLVDLMGLMGDPSDNIPGVPGIGEVIGLRLIKEYGNLDTIYENIEEISGPKRRENLETNKEKAYLSKELATIVTDMPLEINFEDFKFVDANYEKLGKLYRRLELNTFYREHVEKYLPEEELEKAYKYEVIGLNKIENLISEIKKVGKFSFKFFTDGENPMINPPLYLGIKPINSEVKIVDLQEEANEIFKHLKGVFEDNEIEKYGHGIKEDLVILFKEGIEIENITFDSKIAEYLIDPAKRSYSINVLSEIYLNYYGIDEEELLGKGAKKKTISQIDSKKREEYISFYLGVSEKLIPPLKDALKEHNMLELYYDIELPLVEVLASMEFEGFKVDKSELLKLEEVYGKELDELTEEIHKMAGSEFNINSPKQLGEVLFEDLKLPVIKRTKTGYSTNAEVLEKLQGKHPIIDKIFRYREIAKLKSTYIDGMMELINKETGRIHSSFNQTITATGRISSTEPNLQNIPIRTEDGRKIRKAFVAKDGTKLVDADYSQIELRVLAHISEDEKMIEAFKLDEDIHRKTASEVFNIKGEEVTEDLRDRAKAVNFGIIYGISDYGLSEDLKISRKEAKEYIDNYLKNYPKVKEYMDNIVTIGKEQGYVETIFNRRRYLPELREKNYFKRSFAERAAMNTPIQGSAADIIKIAMVRVYKEIKNRKLKSKLILQVHDELVIETVEEEKLEVEKMLKDTMESIIELKVPLKVDLKVGDSWYETM